MNFNSFRLKTIEIVLLIVTVVVLASGAAALQSQDVLAEKVVRLHVLANSDSEADQALKLMVRDAILERSEQLLEKADNRKDAEGLLRGQLLELEDLAARTIREAGYDYPVAIELTETVFPTRKYESFSLPAGEYLALRVLIGDAAGQNWWCVVFPPLCTVVASDLPKVAGEAGFTAKEVELITTDSPTYVIQFKLLELLQKNH